MIAVFTVLSAGTSSLGALSVSYTLDLSPGSSPWMLTFFVQRLCPLANHISYENLISGPAAVTLYAQLNIPVTAYTV
jgi:hypothetical protein